MKFGRGLFVCFLKMEFYYSHFFYTLTPSAGLSLGQWGQDFLDFENLAG